MRCKKKLGTLCRLTLILSLSFLMLALASCDSGPDLPIVTGGVGMPSDTAVPPETDAVTEYVPVIDEDADRVDGIAIRSAEELAKIGVDKDYPLDGDYVLVIDLDLSELESWTPIGNSDESGAYTGKGIFSGTFDGRNHVIKGLTIETTTDKNSFWGLFGTVGSKSKSDPAVVKNIVFKNVNITLSSNATTAVGALSGQVNGFVDISCISLLSGQVSFSGGGSVGVGGMIGQCRTQKTKSVSNNGINIEDVFSNVSVSCENGGWDISGGLIGRIRDSALGKLSNALFVGKAEFEGRLACAIASGDNTAKVKKNVYFLEKMGQTRDGLGEAMSAPKLKNGTLQLSGSWNVTSGIYPLLADVMSRPDFTVLDLTTISFSGSETEKKIKSNFRLPSTAAGLKVVWTSDNPDVISVNGSSATVKQPEEGYVDVKLTATSGSYTKVYTMRVIASRTGYFITDYVVAGKPIEVGGYPEECSFKWIIKDMATGSKRVERTDVPQITLTEEDLESLITVEAEGYDDISIYYSYLPIIYIEAQKKYAAVNKSSYTDAEMRICASEEYADYLYDGDIGIRLRGNSTARLAKKPFKLKLDTKANLLGIDKEGANKHWCLMANGMDPTLMRNILIQDFSNAIGTDTYMASENVVVIYNGEYVGVYQLTEHVRVDETRVDIYDWQEYAEDAAKAIADAKYAAGEIGNAEATRLAEDIEDAMLKDWSWMSTGEITVKNTTYKLSEWGLPELPPQTGGFLLEMDFYSQNDATLARTETAYRQPIYFNTPEPVGKGIESFMETPLYRYAYNYIQSFEYAIHSDDFYFRVEDPQYQAIVYDRWNWKYEEVDYKDEVNDGLHYSEMFDMESLVNNFIFCEVIMNWDTMKNSMFVYKDIDGLAYIAPQWDFDWAWGNVLWNGNTWCPTEWHCRCQTFMVEQYYQEEQWNCLLIRDPYFLVKVWERWHELRENEIEDLVGKGGIMDDYIGYMRKAALANDAKWASQITWGNNFESETTRMKDFVNTRMTWLDQQFTSVEKLVGSLGVYKPSDKLKVDDVRFRSNETEIEIEVEDSEIKYVMVQINGTTMIEAPVTGGEATVKIDSSILDMSGYNCITVYAEDSEHEYIINEMFSDKGNYNNVVSTYHYFKLG